MQINNKLHRLEMGRDVVQVKISNEQQKNEKKNRKKKSPLI